MSVRAMSEGNRTRGGKQENKGSDHIDVLQNHPHLKINLRNFRAGAVEVISCLRREGYLNGSPVEISVVFEDDAFLRALKRKHFGKDVITDVVAFPQENREPGAESREGKTNISNNRGTHSLPPAVLGDVVISLDRAKQQAAEHGHSFSDEVLYLFIHGVLHLLGFRDSSASVAKRMLEKQNRLWDTIRLDNGKKTGRTKSY